MNVDVFRHPVLDTICFDEHGSVCDMVQLVGWFGDLNDIPGCVWKRNVH